jgi:hypothetical protein
MSISPKIESVPKRSFQKLENAASAALLATAVFAGAPRSAQGIVYLGTSDQSWFNVSNWATTSATATGTLPEVLESGGVGSTLAWVGINANNAHMPAVGVLFDPANDSLTPGGKNGNYLANITNGTNVVPLLISNTSVFSSPGPAAASPPNKLTIESGTIETWQAYVGRDGQGAIVQNGGVFIDVGQKLGIESESNTETIGSGTYEYHGGTLIAGNQIHVAGESSQTGISLTSSGVGKLVVYNDGPDGAIVVSNGMIIGNDFVASNSNTGGLIGIAEFHYDLNPENVGNIRPVQDDFNTTNGQLKLNNGTASSARLNLVLDAVPTVTNGQVQNLGLFKTQRIDNDFTSPALFFSFDGLNAFTQGATIAAAYSGIAYSWTISYSGVISFDNSATSAYTSSDISALGGTDVVLVGIPVPEPGSIALLGGAGSMILARRKRRNISI